MRSVARGVFLLVVVGLASAWGLAGAAVASSPSPKPALSASGTIEGDLNTTSTQQVRVRVVQAQGLQHVKTVDVVLELRNAPLETLRFTPSSSLVEIVGFPPPARLGQTGVLLGSYFKVDPSKVKLQAQGTNLLISFPMHLLVNPPAGARLGLTASDDLGAKTPFESLTPPVTQNSGFSIGTLLLAIAVAVFAGGFIGNLVSSRRRPPARPSIYGVAAKRMEEEKAKT